MIYLRLTFPAGRYHATPWGRHVNEGAVEWPPAPWRIMRGLLATWFWKGRDQIAEPVVRSLLAKLAGALPSFRLPPAGAGHTRHYMPVISGRDESSSRIFDAFVALDKRAALFVAWPVSLTDAERAALGLLLRQLAYLGRAESLVDGDIVESPDENLKINSRPLTDGGVAGTGTEDHGLQPGEELVRALAAETPARYELWRKETAAQPGMKGKALPSDIFDVLLAVTGDLQKDGWPLPPGSRFVDYTRSRDCFASKPKETSKESANLPTVVRFALFGSVLPSVTKSLWLAEKIHRILAAKSAKDKSVSHSVFTGKDGNNIPLDKDHDHTIIICEPNSSRGVITHVTLYARMGYDSRARILLEKLRAATIYSNKLIRIDDDSESKAEDGQREYEFKRRTSLDLNLILETMGSARDFASSRADASDCHIFGTSLVWKSLTPFVPTRHAKTCAGGAPKRDSHGLQIGSPEHDLRRLLMLELGSRDSTAHIQIMEVELIPNGTRIGERHLRWSEFQTTRYHGEGLRAGTQGYGFRVTFSHPVSGPLACGYASHFGLGVFLPEY